MKVSVYFRCEVSPQELRSIRAILGSAEWEDKDHKTVEIQVDNNDDADRLIQKLSSTMPHYASSHYIP
jgi:hypothetical protein